MTAPLTYYARHWLAARHGENSVDILNIVINGVQI